ncbi:uncharacterized protein Z519_05992 [Cladophialophora bantiana CBS 173.52]|uniref:Uncharacterized protein n=1 Tax=Cladophialophora bantiana (strain ATCC 10958 / CBS 173.52 / CDC B-1940 / NIH 8579) TaxID=1442370 RepID=A0A0D2G3Z6_CLAB1|nr:uncharacterized protein Z519_05992 [Cladophialophora bantiana CBS 173.52]KIW93387.1 hypothetical protein Z519_05992 [Cladophialophora bantiana CBS 173.52]
MAPTSTKPQFLRSLSSTSSLKPTKDKPRLYIVLYPRSASSTNSSFRSALSCDSYHWSIVVGPQTARRADKGIRYHVAHLNHDTHRHFYEEQDIPSNPIAQSGLVRVAVCKVTDEERLHSILRELPIPGDDSAFNCLTWVRQAFCKLHEDGKSVKSYLNADDWQAVETCARKYCKRKRDAGRFQEGNGPLNNNGGNAAWSAEKISTFNFWENRETTP